MNVLFALIQALPEIIKLLERLDKTKKNKRIKDDISEINKAFDNNDAASLNKLFSSLHDN